MTNLTVKIEGMNKIAAAFQKAPKIVIEELAPAIKKSIAQLISASAPFTPFDKGLLLNRNDIIFTRLSGKLQKQVPYASYVHDGTRFKAARPFFQKGAEASKNTIQGFFDTALKNITSKLSK